MIGRAQLHRQLQSVPRIIRAEVGNTLRQQAADLSRQIRTAAPRDDGVLQASVGWKWLQRRTDGREGFAVRVFAGGRQAFYATFLEFGTSTRKPHPFFWPVYRANRSRIRGALSRAVTRAVRKGI